MSPSVSNTDLRWEGSLHASPRAVQGWTQLIGTLGFEIAEVRQIDLKGKTVCPSPDWCSKQNYMPLWH